MKFKSLAIDSRQVTQGTLFFAIEGSARDGHDHLNEVVQKGAQGLVVSKPEKVPATFRGEVIVVSDVRDELAQRAADFFAHPDREMKLIGVTGTNGKTTTVYMLEHLLNLHHQDTAVLGTIDHHLHNHVWKSELTTPDIISLFSRLRQVRDLGAKVVAMEISSHALDQKRVRGLALDIGIWTNLTRDHMDYHQTEAAYFAAKQKMFEENLSQKNGIAILNGDDPKLTNVQVNAKKTYRFGRQGNFRYEIFEQRLSHSKFRLESPFGNADFFLPTPGGHNISNATGALAAALCLGVPIKNLQESLSSFYGTRGRLERVPNDKGLHVFVDYAHTPDAVRSSLSSLKELLGEKSPHQLWIVFGFGGDRDRGKRPLMVKEAMALADRLVLTSDNPRGEDPLRIIADGLSAVDADTQKKRFHVEVDRRQAIAYALQSAKENDVILIAGKGHETYQIVGSQVLDFSDKDTVLEILK